MTDKLPDHLTFLKVRCRSCGTLKQIKTVRYPWEVGSLLPVEGFGRDAACLKCGKTMLEVQPREDPPAPEQKPAGWARDPNRKKE